MADMHFKEHCPCGNTIEVSGYASHVQPQITYWRSIHNKHMNAIAKQIALNWKWPLYQITPEGVNFEGSPSAGTQETS